MQSHLAPSVNEAENPENRKTISWQLKEELKAFTLDNTGFIASDYFRNPNGFFKIYLGETHLNISKEKELTDEQFKTKLKLSLKDNGIIDVESEAIDHFITIFCNNLHQGFFSSTVIHLHEILLNTNKSIPSDLNGSAKLEVVLVIEKNGNVLTGGIQVNSKLTRLTAIVPVGKEADPDKIEIVDFILKSSGTIPLNALNEAGGLEKAECQVVASPSFVAEIQAAMDSPTENQENDSTIPSASQDSDTLSKRSKPPLTKASLSHEKAEKTKKNTKQILKRVLALGLTMAVVGGATVGGYFALGIGLGVAGIGLTAGTAGIGVGVLLGLLAITAIVVLVQRNRAKKAAVQDFTAITQATDVQTDSRADANNHPVDELVTQFTFQPSNPPSGSSKLSNKSTNSLSDAPVEDQANRLRRGSTASQ